MYSVKMTATMIATMAAMRQKMGMRSPMSGTMKRAAANTSTTECGLSATLCKMRAAAFALKG
jgi:hypothetical protein